MTVEESRLSAALVELLLAQMEVANAAAVWLTVEPLAPLTQLRDLSDKLAALDGKIRAARKAGREAYLDERERQRALGEPEVVLGRWSDVA
jgi:hypothetical protein